ncbi:hypothetical protein E2C01_089269 [Portunus trituberculatus]|uniref:Uncharacterized protein n=1 Tax=Portunus trituberculatus TaxID=210409 RepID=A0A5B7JLT4_PORTR|nr:hypothetical protein [Portunus trituberculatus]
MISLVTSWRPSGLEWNTHAPVEALTLHRCDSLKWLDSVDYPGELRMLTEAPNVSYSHMFLERPVRP